MRSNIRSRAHNGRISAALVVSYIFDWLIIIIAAGVGGALSIITPNKRPFSLTNPEISFPYVEKEKISSATLIICGLVAPAAIILLVCLLLVPGPTVSKSAPKSLIWQRKLWEWHQGWLGLALSLAAAWLITSGMKNLFGKPRPDLLSRCQPDLEHIANYVLSGFPKGDVSFNPANGSALVSATICQQTDKSLLNDGFRSYPSGHASFSAAGLIYLSLFLASKLGIVIPFLAPGASSSDGARFSAFPSRAEQNRAELQSLSQGTAFSSSEDPYPVSRPEPIIGARNQAAAPPVYLLVFAIIPFFASIYISSTRYSDFRHHGFDILFGYFIGIVCATFAFRYYHLPIQTGAGWSWGPRSRDRSFWAGVGVGNYVSCDITPAVNGAPTEASGREPDLERGSADRQVSHEVGPVGAGSEHKILRINDDAGSNRAS